MYLEKVKKINEGLAPLDEPLLAETIRAGHSRLRATLDPRETVAADATFFIPPSPSLPDGSFFHTLPANPREAESPYGSSPSDLGGPHA